MWWNEFFDQEVAELILEQPRPGEIPFLVKHLDIKPGDRVFDQCCGWGRISGPLAEQGYSVDGVDSSEPLIRYGVERWGKKAVSLTCADAHSYRPDGLVDGSVNLYSSFGYDKDESKHQQMLSRLAASLRPGGRMILDTINPEKVWGGFRPEMRRDWPSGYHLQRQSQLIANRRQLHQLWIFTRPNGDTFQKSGTTRLYTAAELQGMLTKAGLTALKLMGDLESSQFGPQSERLIWLAEKRTP